MQCSVNVSMYLPGCNVHHCRSQQTLVGMSVEISHSLHLPSLCATWRLRCGLLGMFLAPMRAWKGFWLFQKHACLFTCFYSMGLHASVTLGLPSSASFIRVSDLVPPLRGAHAALLMSSFTALQRYAIVRLHCLAPSCTVKLHCFAPVCSKKQLTQRSISINSIG